MKSSKTNSRLLKQETETMTFEQGELVVYQSEDGCATVDVRLKDETVWLTLNQMAELFGHGSL